MFWRMNVRTKLLVMVLPAALGLCGLAGVGVQGRLADRSVVQRNQAAARVADVASSFAHDLQRERLASTIAATAGERPDEGGPAGSVSERRTATDKSAGELAATIDGNRSAVLSSGAVASHLDTLAESLNEVEAVRTAVVDAPALEVVEMYTELIDTVIGAAGGIEIDVETGAGTGAVARRWLAEGIETESAAAATAAVLADVGTPAAEREEAADTARDLLDRSGLLFDTYHEYATDAGRQQFDDARSGSATRASDEYFDDLAGPDAASTFSVDQQTWEGLVGSRLEDVESVESAGIRADLDRLIAAVDEADTSAFVFAAAAAASILSVLLLAFAVSRNIVAALRRLTESAREISHEQLPALVRSLRSGDTTGTGIRFASVDTGTRDEFAEVGESLNELSRAVVTVASEQQQSLQKGISEIFVNLARRNQTLLDRQIEFIDELEANEQDPDQLESLFCLDHLATRMRRNAESLLVLAGAEAPRRRARDVSLSDVIRVAVGEVEDFSRISLIAVDEAVTVGSAAVDVAHLLAELMENGAQYSPPEHTVDVVGHLSSAGGYVITIADHGVGMSDDRLEAANRLMASPPPVGLALSRSLGFVVAGTLACRHGIRVLLSSSPSGGLIVEVALPASMVSPADPAPTPASAPAVAEEIPVVPEVVVPQVVVPEVSVSWGEERLPEAAAPSKLVDMLPEGERFEQGLYGLLERQVPDGVVPPADAALPQRSPGSPAGSDVAQPVMDDFGLAPQRDAAEVRSLLSRYRHGLSAGRTDGQADDEPASGGTAGDPTLPPPYYPDSPGGHEQ